MLKTSEWLTLVVWRIALPLQTLQHASPSSGQWPRRMGSTLSRMATRTWRQAVWAVSGHCWPPSSRKIQHGKGTIASIGVASAAQWVAASLVYPLASTRSTAPLRGFIAAADPAPAWGAVPPCQPTLRLPSVQTLKMCYCKWWLCLCFCVYAAHKSRVLSVFSLSPIPPPPRTISSLFLVFTKFPLASVYIYLRSKWWCNGRLPLHFQFPI